MHSTDIIKVPYIERCDIYNSYYLQGVIRNIDCNLLLDFCSITRMLALLLDIVSSICNSQWYNGFTKV